MCALGFMDFKLLIRARNWYLYLSNRFEFNLSYQAVYLQVLALKPVPWLRWSADRSLLPLASSQLQFFEKQIPERRATLLRVSCHRRDALASLKGRHQVRVGRAGLVSYIRPPGSKFLWSCAAQLMSCDGGARNRPATLALCTCVEWVSIG